VRPHLRRLASGLPAAKSRGSTTAGSWRRIADRYPWLKRFVCDQFGPKRAGSDVLASVARLRRQSPHMREMRRFSAPEETGARLADASAWPYRRGPRAVGGARLALLGSSCVFETNGGRGMLAVGVRLTGCRQLIEREIDVIRALASRFAAE